jgi:hypothetical protein
LRKKTNPGGDPQGSNAVLNPALGVILSEAKDLKAQDKLREGMTTWIFSYDLGRSRARQS